MSSCCSRATRLWCRNLLTARVGIDAPVVASGRSTARHQSSTAVFACGRGRNDNYPLIDLGIPVARRELTSRYKTLIETDAVRVRHFRGRGKVVVFTFTPWMPAQSHSLNPDYYYAADFLVKHGFDVVGFRAMRNHWYQDIDAELLRDVSNAVRTEERAGYGSSMGGYAAIVFAGALGLQRVFSISPQFDPRGDSRWPDAASIDFRHVIAASPECEYFVTYDPRSGNDLRHVEQLRQRIPLVEAPLPYSGHPTGHFLADVKRLQPMALSILRGRGAPKLDRRELRRRSPAYYLSLSQAVAAKGKVELALRLCDRANRLASRLHDLGYESAIKAHRSSLLKAQRSHAAESAPLL
jgi:hypothetical protein